jgi:hypothetical protein
MPDKNIVCPKCGAEFSVAESVSKMMSVELDQERHSIQEKLKKEQDEAYARMEREMEERRNTALDELRTTQQMNDEANEKRIRELEESQARIKSESETAILTKTRELEAREAALRATAEQEHLDNERKLRDDRIRLEGEVRQQVEIEAKLKQGESAELVASLSRKITDLERAAQITSQQLQGESQEVVLEEVLRMAFPGDIIEPVPKGCKGADCIQKVRVNGDVLGTIVWESKRTKQWASEWVPKLKDDQRSLAAELAILVTQAFPADMKNKMGNIEGVWITDFASSIGIAMALRAGLIEVARMKTMSDSSDDKTKTLYEYVTSPEFRQSIQAIAETFIAFQTDIASEKRAMEKQWKRRETTIIRALTATTRLHASLQTILGQGVMPDIDENGAKQLTA